MDDVAVITWERKDWNKRIRASQQKRDLFVVLVTQCYEKNDRIFDNRGGLFGKILIFLC